MNQVTPGFRFLKKENPAEAGPLQTVTDIRDLRLPGVVPLRVRFVAEALPYAASMAEKTTDRSEKPVVAVRTTTCKHSLTHKPSLGVPCKRLTTSEADL